MMISAWRKSCLEAKAGENLWGSGVSTHHKKLWQNKLGRDQGNHKDRGEEEDGAQGKSGRGTGRRGEALVSAQ